MTTADGGLVARLRDLSSLKDVPDAELEWLAAHGTLKRFDATERVMTAGDPADQLFVLFSGLMAIHVDRGAGPRRALEWRRGDVSGRLPYSRIQKVPGQVVAEEATELLSINGNCFLEMVRECHEFTSVCVHVMVDRARHFTSSDLQEEKMLSLGKLAAGLAHELNNPASAATRSADELTRAVRDLETTAVALGAAGLKPSGYDAIARLGGVHAKRAPARSAIEQADWEDVIDAWAGRHGISEAAVEPLADSAITIAVLDEVAAELTPDQLQTALSWFIAGHSARRLSRGIEIATERIYSLVAAVKGFTYMDQAAVPKPVDVAKGLADTLMVLGAKAKGRSVQMSLEVEPGLPKVVGLGGELNQVWSNLVDNALDAVAKGGHITVSAARAGECVLVTVTDDGSGIASDVQGRIFEPFFTTKAPGSGTGLGLDIVHRLIRKQGGTITVESEPGRTMFSVSLPQVRG